MTNTLVAYVISYEKHQDKQLIPYFIATFKFNLILYK